MKTLLSIFTIGIGTLAFTLPTVTACKSKPKPQSKLIPSKPAKLNLHDLRITGIVPTSAWDQSLTINIKNAYDKIVNKIIQAYNARKYSTTPILKAADFSYGATIKNGKSWAIEVLKSDDQTRFNPPTGTGDDNQTIIVADSKNSNVLLDDNGLKVMVRTTNPNIKNTNAQAITIKAYLNKFIYSGANINQGFDIYGTLGTPTVSQLTHSWDISRHFSQITNFVTQASLKTMVKNFATTHPSNAAAISKKILIALNTQLEKETKILNNWGVLKIETNKVINFKATTPIIYWSKRIKKHDYVIEMTGDKQTAPVGAKIYACFWNLGLNNYLANANAFCFFKLGTVLHMI